MIVRRIALSAATACGLLALPAGAQHQDLPRQKVELVAPPFVHPHEQATKAGPKILEFRLVVEEKQFVIDDEGTKLQGMTFNGSVPGPMMVVHEGDYVEVTLVNPDTNSMPHNIDFHSAAGASGGADLTLINPGEEAVIRWKATRTGVFVYHCIPDGMAPWHIMAGMSGAVMVLPRDGLKDGKGKALVYDRIYYIGEHAYYVPRDEKGKFKHYHQHGDAYADTMELMRKLVPTHVVFNGRVGALTGKNAMPAKVGESVLIVHSQPDRDTRPHLVGGFGDYVWETGKFSNPPEADLETWFIRGGSAGAALTKFLQPGIVPYVNHATVEAFELGATAHFRVEGAWDNDLMAQVKAPEPIGTAPSATETPEPAAKKAEKADALPLALPASTAVAAHQSRAAEPWLIKADELLRRGDVAGARLALERAVRAGNVLAVFKLAETYDPKRLSEWRARGIRSDPQKARELYERAYSQGVQDAQERLAGLRS